METEQPREAILKGDVATRSAAARDLARIGNFKDLPTLIELATTHKSSAIRLYTAAAAASILSRYRGLPGHSKLTRKQEDEVLQLVTGTDPGINPPLLMALSALKANKVVDRLGRMLRDPRNTVRAGAAAAVRRRVLSAAHFDPGYVQKSAASWFADRKMPADSLLELIKLVGEAGMHPLADEVRKASSAGRNHVAEAETALTRLAMRGRAESWTGIWQSDGLDVLEVNPEVRVPQWRAIADGVISGPGAEGELALQDDGTAIAGGKRWRMLWAPRQGEAESFHALQCEDGRTFYKLVGSSLIEGAQRLADALSAAPVGALAASIDSLEPGDDKNGDKGKYEPGAQLAQGILLWRAGDAQAAIDKLSGIKKAPAEAAYWLGVVQLDSGDAASGRASIEKFLKKAKKKHPLRAKAEGLL